jgi:hypothetical protein
MAEQADVYVKNTFTDKTIDVIRNLAGGGSDPAVTIPGGEQEQFYLGGTDVSLTVKAPTGMDTKECYFHVQSDVDLAVSHSRTDSNWGLRIVPNSLPPDTPTTVNVNLGGIEPE